MYEWLTVEKKVEPNKAIKTVLETFVYYDVPTSKELQYLNDIGLAMFTKYAVRIQKVIYRMLRDNPDAVIGLYVMEQLVGNIIEPTDSWSLLPGMNNPFGSLDVMTLPGLNLALDIGDVAVDLVNPFN